MISLLKRLLKKKTRSIRPGMRSRLESEGMKIRYSKTERPSKNATLAEVHRRRKEHIETLNNDTAHDTVQRIRRALGYP